MYIDIVLIPLSFYFFIIYSTFACVNHQTLTKNLSYFIFYLLFFI